MSTRLFTRAELDALKGERKGHVSVAAMDSLLINFLPAGRIEDLNVGGLLVRPVQTRSSRALDILLLRVRRINRHFDLFAQRDKLFDSRGPLQVASDQNR